MLTNRLLTGSRSLLAAPSRRDVLRGLIAGLGLGGAYPSLVTAGKKRKQRRKKRKQHKPGTPNEFGCIEVGDRCTSADSCCSGVCSGKKGKRRCQAAGQGTCAPEAPGVCHATTPTITICNNAECWCARTTGDSAFCANAVGTVSCDECRTDTDCVNRGFPAGSACVPWSSGLCGGPCAGKAVCLLPCGVDLPEQM